MIQTASKFTNDEIECIFIQTSFMRKMFKEHPEIQHIDATFRVNIESLCYGILLLKEQSLKLLKVINKNPFFILNRNKPRSNYV